MARPTGLTSVVVKVKNNPGPVVYAAEPGAIKNIKVVPATQRTNKPPHRNNTGAIALKKAT